MSGSGGSGLGVVLTALNLPMRTVVPVGKSCYQSLEIELFLNIDTDDYDYNDDSYLKLIKFRHRVITGDSFLGQNPSAKINKGHFYFIETTGEKIQIF